MRGKKIYACHQWPVFQKFHGWNPFEGYVFLFLFFFVFFIAQANGQGTVAPLPYGVPMPGGPLDPGALPPVTLTPTPTPTPSPTSRIPFGTPATATSTMLLMPFNPFLDNHLKAPTTRIGLFGLQVSAVERALRSYGAKPHSYSFGKCSRMTFSVYLISMFFDRDRRLGRILVEPRPPFTKVEPQAQTFFMKLFLEGEEMSRFKTVISSNKMEISFAEDPSPKVTPKSVVATKSRSL